MELSFKVILIPHKREKDLVFNTKSRFFQNNWIPAIPTGMTQNGVIPACFKRESIIIRF